MEDRLSDFRAVFAEAIVARAACRDPRIKTAFARVPRHAFVPPGPWRFAEDGPFTASADPALIYQDLALALVSERGIPTGLPSLHARCIDACGLGAGESVVQIGAGAGYFTAVLAELVGPSGKVRAFEIDPALATAAERNLSPWAQVRVEARSGTEAEGPADLIYVCAGVQQIPIAWLRAVRPGGRLMVPLTPGETEGGVLLVKHIDGERYDARFVAAARFVPCIGATDPVAAKDLRAAFARGDAASVSSLRVAPERPDSSAWFAGDGWWLSCSLGPDG
jgi:protein-L-isoaspartate(D-aspartate) O-methyltransferase